jgi:hypothetical protein
VSLVLSEAAVTSTKSELSLSQAAITATKTELGLSKVAASAIKNQSRIFSLLHLGRKT